MIDATILAAVEARLAAALTGQRRPPHALVIDGERLGAFDTARRDRLAAFRDVFAAHGDDLAFRPHFGDAAARSMAFEPVARALAAEGRLTAWRDERYPVARAFDAPPAFLVERAAARYLGIHTWAAHANGLVRAPTGVHMWFARRSPTKAIDPGLLDNLVGGGIAAGEAPLATLVREAWEEAGIPDAHARRARRAGTLTIERVVPDGFQHETIFAYDVWLDAAFRPGNRDGEAVEHRLVDLASAARLLANDCGPDVVTIDATRVALACLCRLD